MGKKFFLFLIGAFLLLSLVNVLIGLFFWIRNFNRKPLESYVDAPYVYFQKNNDQHPTGFDISPGISRSKDSNELRILLLGGSVANALGNVGILADTLSWNGKVSYLQQQIQQKFPSKKITVLNGAIPAFVSQQEFIAFQTFLQHYQPNIVVAVHGFNDVESFKMNHLIDDPKFIPSPLFYAGSWNTPLFNIVEAHKEKYRLSGIFSGYYNHISKAYEFSTQASGLQKNSQTKVDHLNDSVISAYATAHVNVVRDLFDFCKSKNMVYLNFLQPARFYHPRDPQFHGSDAKPISPILSKLYLQIDTRLSAFPFNISLTYLDPAKLEYTDECHPSLKGYKYFADSIIPYVISELEKTTQTISAN